MTYCAAISVDTGVVLVSDSRTNAGVDQISTYSKMHKLISDGERMITLLSSGNLATSQAVVRTAARDVKNEANNNIKTLTSLADVAEYIADISRAEQKKYRAKTDDGFNPEASFILAGQIRGFEQQIFLVYPEGNYIRAAKRHPFLQIGEIKYGKPILDRIVEPQLDLQTAAQCALVSMDSTMRSNLSVGPPIELLVYEADSFKSGAYYNFSSDDEYLRALRDSWHGQLRDAFSRLPELPSHSTPMRIIDGSTDQ